MSLFENCKLAISSLQKPDQTKQANQWLVDFSKSKEAWEVCDLLLCETSRPHRFFGSITLYGKVQRDLSQLSQEQVQSLVQRLIQHVLNYANESNYDMQSGRYVCLSIAATVVQLNVNGIVQQVLNWLNPIISTCPLLLLELLVALPEECFNYHTCVSDEYRDNFSNELSQSVNEIFNFLQFLSQKSESQNFNQILKCLEMWIIYTDVSSTMISNHPIFNTFVMHCLNNEHLFEQAIDALISICRKFAMENTPNIISLVILPHILPLNSLWDHQLEKFIKHSNNNHNDHDDLELELNICRPICRIVTEVAESLTSSYMLSDTNEEQQSLLSFLIKCISFPYEFTISRIPLKFFYEYALAIKNIKYHNKSILSVNLESRIMYIFPILIETIVTQMMLSNAIIIGERKMNDLEEDKRLELIESIIDCSMAINVSNCIQSLCHLLQQEINKATQTNWSMIESILYAATSIFCDVRREDNQLCSQLIMFIGTLPDLPGIKLTTVSLIGKSAGFLRENEQYIPSLLSYLCKCLNNSFIALEASKAIANISKNCSIVTSFPKEELFTVFQQQKSHNQSSTSSSSSSSSSLTSEMESYLVEALCYIIASLPIDIQENVLEHQLFNHLLNTFQNNLQNPLLCCEKILIHDIDLITTVYRFIIMDSSNCLISTFLKLQPLLVHVMERYPTERICEKCCRCYKYVMKSIGSSFSPYVPLITTFISDSFYKMPYSAFIYSAAVCLSCFVLEEQGKYIPHVYQMLFHIAEKFLTIMNSLQAFEKTPDLIEEFFYFLAKALECCPEPLINSPFISTFIEAAIIGLQLKHRESHKAILCFFERLFEMNQNQQNKMIVLTSCALPVIKCLIQSLAGTLPAYALDENNGSIADTLWIIKISSSSSDFASWIQEALLLLPENKQRNAMYSKFLEITSVDSKYEFSKLIKDFEFRCREKELITM